MDSSWWRDIADLDEDQQNIMDLPLDGRFFVTGPPGSGKTNLLLLRANYAAVSERENLRIIVYTKSLQGFICRGAGRYDFDPRFVVTSGSLIRSILMQEGITLTDGEYEEVRNQRAADLRRLIESGQLAPQFDMVLLDEAQDYTEDELFCLLRLGSNVFVAADSQQRIYGGSDVLGLVDGDVDKHLTLRFHYRNGLEICRLADAIGRHFSSGYSPTEAACNYDEKANPSKVEIIKSDFAGQLRELVDRLLVQLRAYPDQEIGVLLPTKEHLLDVAQAIREAGMGDNLYVQMRDETGHYEEELGERRIWLSTIHAAKGLEFRAVHILCMEENGYRQR